MLQYFMRINRKPFSSFSESSPTIRRFCRSSVIKSPYQVSVIIRTWTQFCHCLSNIYPPVLHLFLYIYLYTSNVPCASLTCLFYNRNIYSQCVKLLFQLKLLGATWKFVELYMLLCIFLFVCAMRLNLKYVLIWP